MNQNPLISLPIPGLIRKIGIPVGIGAFFNTMFNVVDTYYGGLISEEALAALSLSFPFFFIIIAITFGLSTGNSALVGNAMGEGDQASAERFAVQGIVFGVILSLTVSVIALLVTPSLYRLLGASGSYLDMSLSYIQPIFACTVFFMLVSMFNSPISALGNTLPLRNFLVAGFVLNLILDPWFIFGGFGLPAMGITGIALATILVQLIGMLYMAYELRKTGLITRQGLRAYLIPQVDVFRQIARQGFPTMFDLFSVSLGFFALTYFVSQFGQDAVAAYGAATRIEQLVLLPLVGLDVATLTLVSQNNGARQPERVLETMGVGTRYGLIIMLVGAIISTLFANQLMGLFTDNERIIELGAAYVRIKAWALFPSAIYFVSSSTLRGVKRPLYALGLNAARMVVLPTLIVLIFVTWLGFGIITIWWASFASMFLIGAVAYWLSRRVVSVIQQEQLKEREIATPA